MVVVNVGVQGRLILLPVGAFAFVCVLFFVAGSVTPLHHAWGGLWDGEQADVLLLAGFLELAPVLAAVVNFSGS